MSNQEIVLTNITPHAIPDEIIIVKHINGWVYDQSESRPKIHLSLYDLLSYKYHIEPPSDILHIIDLDVQEAFNTSTFIKSSFYIILNNKSYPFEITVFQIAKQFVTIILRRSVKWEIINNSIKFNTLFKQNKIGIIILDVNFNIMDINSWACDILERHKNHFENKSLFEFIDPEDLKRLKRYFELSENIRRNCPVMDLRFVKRNRELTWVSFSISIISEVESADFQYIVVVNDITEQKKMDFEKKKEKMRFYLDDGKLYWIDELSANLCYSVFDDYLSLDYHGLVLSRMPEDNLRSFISGNFEQCYLGNKDIDDTNFDVLGSIKKAILSLPKKSIVLFDDLDYLFTHHEFEIVPAIIHFLKDTTLFKNTITLVSVNKQKFEANDWAILEKEGIILNPSEKKPLSNNELEILRFIHQYNVEGFKPHIEKICLKFTITRPTCRKLINNLIHNKYLIENRIGREKNFVLTNNGRKLLIS